MYAYPQNRMPSTLALLGWLLTSYGAAAIAIFGSRHGTTFYNMLDLPAWAPSPGLLAQVFLVLYAVMAFAAWRIWSLRENDRRRAFSLSLLFFLVQLVANAAWSWFFFTMHSGVLATLDIACALLLSFLTTAGFWNQDRLAGSLMAVYCGWLLNLAAITLIAWRWNPQLLG